MMILIFKKVSGRESKNLVTCKSDFGTEKSLFVRVRAFVQRVWFKRNQHRAIKGLLCSQT